LRFADKYPDRFDLFIDGKMCQNLLTSSESALMPSLAAGSSSPTHHVTFEESVGGELACQLSVDYYNRKLSGWEPMLERWPLNLDWQGYPSTDQQLSLKITSK